MPQPLALAAAWLAAALACLPAARAEHAVDANLVTALDLSDSIMRHEEWIELDGIRRAVSHPDFLAAILAGRHRRIGFAAFTWSSHGDLREVVPWAVLGSAADIERVALALAKISRRGGAALGGGRGRLEAPAPADRLTDVSEAIRHGLRLLATPPHQGSRSVLNILGNGPDNVGEGPEQARDLALGAGVTVNGLVIGKEPGLAAYYRERVATGPGSFVIEAREPTDVAAAMLTKFLSDLQALDVGGGRSTALALNRAEASNRHRR